MHVFIRGALAAACVLATSPAWAGTLEVPQQHETIAAAVAAAQDGDTILISRGRYQESVVSTKRLTFRGKGAIWDGYFGRQNNAQLSVTADGVTVTGITFAHGTVPVTIVGDGATVSRCRFRACDSGVSIDGEDARVERNEFSGQRIAGAATIGVSGPGAVVRSNRMVHGFSAIIDIDAQGAGTATVCRNTVDTTQNGDSYIAVRDAAGAEVMRNVFRNAYRDGVVVELVACDDAVVSGNRLVNLDYDVEGGIHVSGNRVTVTKNTLENLIDYDSDVESIRVDGDDAEVTRNRLRLCGSGEDYDTSLVHVLGDRASVERNSIDDVAGGGAESRVIWVEGDDGTVEKNRIGFLHDETNYGVFYDGNRGRIVGNRVSFSLDGACVRVDGNDFVIERNVLVDGSAGCHGIITSGSSTSGEGAMIRRNTLRFLGEDGIQHTGNGVVISDNELDHLAGRGISVAGDRNELTGNTVSNTFRAAFYIDGDLNELLRCTAKASDGDGFHIRGGRNLLQDCVATDCAAEGLDNSGTETNAIDCRLTGSRIDFAGNGNMARDQGTTFQTGGRLVIPEVD